MRARASVEVHPKTERESIVVTEIPYQVNKAKLVEHIAELVRDKRIEGISDLRDESSREGMRIVIELKRDAMAQVVLNNLYAHTAMQTGFGVTLLSIDGGQPRILNLKEMLERFVAHRRDVVTRRTRFELKQARDREHILLGYQIALDHIDEIIELIKKATDREVAREGLMARFGLSELQAKAILEMQLQRLTGLERQKILDELAEVQKTITRLKEILASEKVLLEVIVEELKEVKQLFADERRTEILGDAEDISTEDLIAEEEMVVTVSHAGYVKRNPVSLYRAQRRGGRGRTGGGGPRGGLPREPLRRLHPQLPARLLRQGEGLLAQGPRDPAGRPRRARQAHREPRPARPGREGRGHPPGAAAAGAAGQRRRGGRRGAGAPPRARRPRRPRARTSTSSWRHAGGSSRRPGSTQFARPRAAGIIALGIEEGDELIAARLTDGHSHLLLSTAQGMAIRFEESDVRAMGRTAYGVKGITLDEGDAVVSRRGRLPPAAAGRKGASPRRGPTILTVTANGYGKRTELAEYRVQTRGGKGLITIKTTERNGPVVAAAAVIDAEEVMLITNGGMLIRMPAKGISVIGRNTQGVRLITLESKEEQVVAVARVAETTDAAEAAGVREEPEGAAPVESAPVEPEDGGGEPSRRTRGDRASAGAAG